MLLRAVGPHRGFFVTGGTCYFHAILTNYYILNNGNFWAPMQAFPGFLHFMHIHKHANGSGLQGHFACAVNSVGDEGKQCSDYTTALLRLV